jgi:membrane protein implicated in regulation of membrane protease activity
VEPYLYWVIAAIALVIVELVTGTFYLLVLAVAAAAAAALAWYGTAFSAQAGFATAVGAVGVVLVHRFRLRSPSMRTGSNAIDLGQRVTLESWVNEGEGLARVNYRGALWDAKLVGAPAPGRAYYIRGIEGSTLHIAAADS